MKACSKCYRDLPLEDYARRSNVPGGRRSECKQCQAQYRRARREADPEAARHRDRQTYWLHREAILDRKRRDRMLTPEDVKKEKEKQ